MKKEEMKYERDEFYYCSFMWAVISAGCVYFDQIPTAIFTGCVAGLFTIIGICIHYWIRKHQ